MTKHRPIWPHGQRAHDSQSLRTYRARSWIRAAKLCQSLDGRFICFWLGFNALYGRREATDRADMEWFLKQMVDLRDQAIRSRLLSLKREATALLGLEFLYRSYWSDGFTDALGEEMMRRLVNLEVAWRSGTLEACLHDVFDCLYELRNQILHGSAAFGSSRNRDSLEAAIPLLSALLPPFRRAVRAHEQARDWGDEPKPPKGSTRHPRDRRKRFGVLRVGGAKRK